MTDQYEIDTWFIDSGRGKKDSDTAG